MKGRQAKGQGRYRGAAGGLFGGSAGALWVSGALDVGARSPRPGGAAGFGSAWSGRWVMAIMSESSGFRCEHFCLSCYVATRGKRATVVMVKMSAWLGQDADVRECMEFQTNAYGSSGT